MNQKYYSSLSAKDKQNLGLLVLGILSLIILIFWVGIFSQWDLKFWWFDVVLHLLGGAFCLAFFEYFFTLSEAEGFGSKIVILGNGGFLVRLIVGLGFAALVGVVWEWFEFALDFLNRGNLLQPSLTDTMQDLLNDLLGACFIYIWIFKLKKKRPPEFLNS